MLASSMAPLIVSWKAVRLGRPVSESCRAACSERALWWTELYIARTGARHSGTITTV